MNNTSIIEYFEALERLKADEPNVVPRGTRISNDAVSLEAGRSKGSIKKSRTIFADLIVAIDLAADEQLKRENAHVLLVRKWKESAKEYQEKWEASLGRELSLLLQIYDLKQKLHAITGANILPMRRVDDESAK